MAEPAAAVVENDMLPVDKYIRAVALCNNLALLASQGTMTIFIQRFGLLTKLQKGWTNGLTLEIACRDSEGATYLEQIDVSATALENIDNNALSSMDVKPDPENMHPFGSMPIFLEEADDDTITEPWQPPSDDEHESGSSPEKEITKRPTRTRSSSKSQQKLKQIVSTSLAKAKASLNVESNHQQEQQLKPKPGEDYRIIYLKNLCITDPYFLQFKKIMIHFNVLYVVYILINFAVR
jgi:hypothetical protein